MTELRLPKLSAQHLLFLDFEAYYSKDFNLDKYTTAEYVRDDRYETLGVGVKLDDEPTLWMEHEEFVHWIKTRDWSDTAVVAHNSMLESLICAERYGIQPAFWFDTLSMSRALNLPGSLAALAHHFGVGEKGDELKNSFGKHRKDFTVVEYAQLGLYCIQDVDLTKAIFDQMVKSYPEAELWLIHFTIRMFCNPKYVLDEPMLREYMADEKARKEALLQRVGLTKKDVGSNDKLAQAFWDLGADPPTKISKKTKKEVYAFAKDDVGMQALLEHEIEEVRWLAEARLAVKSTINSSRGARFLELGKLGRRMPVQLNYYAAHTGRWGGAGATNFQNLERVIKTDPRKGKLKKSLLAPPGWKVIAVDSSQIEARGVAWLAEHAEMVAKFAAGVDLYSEFASLIYNREVNRKKNKEDEIPGYIAKTVILGMGYGQGFSALGENFLKGSKGPRVQFGAKEIATMGVDVDKFLTDERKMKQVQKVLSRLNLEDRVMHYSVADHLVKTYRTTNKPIPALWRFLTSALKALEEGVEGYFGPNDCLQTVKDGIILPNGLMLHYPELHQSKKPEGMIVVDEDGEEVEEWRLKGYSYFDGFKRTRIYGGALTENLCQALARIVIGEQLLHIHAETGYEPVSATHDEWIFIAPDSDAEPLTKYVVQTMHVPPKWAKGWPLAAEGGYAQSYGMAKA